MEHEHQINSDRCWFTQAFVFTGVVVFVFYGLFASKVAAFWIEIVSAFDGNSSEFFKRTDTDYAKRREIEKKLKQRMNYDH